MRRTFARLFGRAHASDAPISYEESRELARHPDTEVRRRLAARRDLRPEVLYYLAEDDCPEVRREIAVNEATPPKADLLLARDRDEEVRCVLAGKIARLTPGLSDHERARIRELTVETLELLARDQIARVRRILAETLKDVADAPHHVIRSLARDTELAVAAPVLQFSPLLTDEDLLEIIASPPVVGALTAISKRSAVSEAVSDAIAETDDTQAVAALLANPSAQIREETLDRLVEGARRETLWQMPLAARPHLPLGAARKLASFVADAALAVLMRRTDLDAETLEAVSEAVHERMDRAAEDSAGTVAAPGGEAAAGGRPPRRDPGRMAEYVQRLYASGDLDAERIDEALASGNASFVTHALALKAGIPSSVVSRIASSRSAKAVTALAWKAGLDMPFAVRLQTGFARVPPREVLQPGEDNAFPLTEDDMTWQLDFYAG